MTTTIDDWPHVMSCRKCGGEITHYWQWKRDDDHFFMGWSVCNWCATSDYNAKIGAKKTDASVRRLQ